MGNTREQINYLIDEWHRAITTRDIDALMALYTEDAVIESSAVLVIEEDMTGTLRGKNKLRRHFEAFFELVGQDAPDWFRFEPAYVGDRLLLWEYPSIGPAGNQLDVVESFDVEDGRIVYHRVYWGWRGFQLLDQARTERGTDDGIRPPVQP